MKFKIKISLKNNYCKHTGYWLFNRSSMQSSIRWSLCNNRIVSVGLIIVPPAFKNPTKSIPRVTFNRVTKRQEKDHTAVDIRGNLTITWNGYRQNYRLVGITDLK